MGAKTEFSSCFIHQICLFSDYVPTFFLSDDSMLQCIAQETLSGRFFLERRNSCKETKKYNLKLQNLKTCSNIVNTRNTLLEKNIG